MAKTLFCEACDSQVDYELDEYATDVNVDIDGDGYIDGTVDVYFNCVECGEQIGHYQAEPGFDATSLFHDVQDADDCEYEVESADAEISEHDDNWTVTMQYEVKRTVIQTAYEGDDYVEFAAEDIQEA